MAPSKPSGDKPAKAAPAKAAKPEAPKIAGSYKGDHDATAAAIEKFDKVSAADKKDVMEMVRAMTVTLELGEDQKVKLTEAGLKPKPSEFTGEWKQLGGDVTLNVTAASGMPKQAICSFDGKLLDCDYGGMRWVYSKK